MDIKWVGAHPNNYEEGRRGKTPELVVVHWIVGTLESADATFANPDRRASAHYGIGDKEIHQYVRESDTAYHASNFEINLKSIGIEHEGGWMLSDGTRQQLSDDTYQTSGALIADICNRFNIPIDEQHIVPHSKYSATQCPGSTDIRRLIQIAKDQITPDPDKIKVDLGEPWGVMEVQAINSTLNDQKRDLENCQKNCETKVKLAVESANLEKDEYWQSKVDTANDRINELEQTISNNLSTYDWKVLLNNAWINFWNRGGDVA